MNTQSGIKNVPGKTVPAKNIAVSGMGDYIVSKTYNANVSCSAVGKTAYEAASRLSDFSRSINVKAGNPCIHCQASLGSCFDANKEYVSSVSLALTPDSAETHPQGSGKSPKANDTNKPMNPTEENNR